jgi:hypothetical protein
VQHHGDTATISATQIIASISISIPYSTLLSESGIVFRCPEACSAHGQCRSCSWLSQRTPALTGKELDIGSVIALIKSAAVRYDVVSFCSNSPSEVELVWILRSPVRRSGSLHSKSCEEDGISTCGIEFCSDEMSPSDCVSSNMMLLLQTVVSICRRRVSMRIHSERPVCRGFHQHPNGSSSVFIVRENPSILKLLQYSMLYTCVYVCMYVCVFAIHSVYALTSRTSFAPVMIPPLIRPIA